ncbi:hypothetical protein GCM10011613_25460 [Cellvibrio zantedeschiae]|uniref:Uncharacterized protein n=1 Tax=Cellvibrio zantedeschiae TaxID=1237077 RepID=A0ABQ3B4Z1_9GAMM|nr:PHP-associated domain-containing protein [Cellvibrio zantedeschiae]GGY79508.1 hypothetical protein GCM10011613_25460 [Cellvibrio zantedeschiae]
MNWVGARWWKFDFHTHTPASFDYGRGDQNAMRITHRDWLLSFINKGIQCVAVTDHNSGAWLPELQRSAEVLRAEGHTIFVFPGVEITANSNIHILAIFDPTATGANVEAIIGAAKFRGTRGDSDAVSEESPEQIVEEIRKSGGVAIPAHIDMKAGLCQLSSHTVNQTAKKSSAVEIVNPTLENQYAPLSRYRNLNVGLPEIIGSDSHHPNEVGRAFTWVKMGEPSIEGLKLALIDGSSSIRRSDQTSTDPNKTSNMILQSLSIANAKYAGRPAALTVRFNPWLNSIIGGRGSGKSSLLEFIRIGMDRSKDLTELQPNNEIRRVFEHFIQKSGGRDSEGVMLDTTEINCIYTKYNVNYLLQWKYSTQKVSAFKSDGQQWIPEPGDVHSRFPIKIFSQKQIFDLAKNPNTLLKLIDDSDFVDYASWSMLWEEKRNLFLRLCGQKRELEGKVKSKSVLTGALADVQRKIEIIEQSGHADILQKYQSAVSQMDAYLATMRYLNDVKRKLGETVGSIAPLAPFPLESLTSSDPKFTENYNQLTVALQNLTNEVKYSIVRYEDAITGFKVWFEQSATSLNINTSKDSYNQLVTNLEAAGIGNVADYGKLLTQRAELQGQINALTAIEVELNSVAGQTDVVYRELVSLRSQLTVRRASFLDTFIKQNSSISVAIEPFMNDEEIDSSFRKLIGRLDSTFSSDIYDAERSTGILQALLSKTHSTAFDLSSLEGLNARLDLIYKFKIDLLNYKNGAVLDVGLGKRFADFLSQLPIQTFDQLAFWFPEDRLTLKFLDGNRLKDISQGSAGQKAAAILTFLLSYGEEPLLLDQPEDDLDNGLITSMIVSKLQENKGRRQIFVVTHNPNIVVNADSDYVIALQSKGKIELLAAGPLQDGAVRRNVCEIMEGGEIALQKRYKRMFNI